MDRRNFLTSTAGALTLAASSCNGAGGKAKFTPESRPPAPGPATRVILTGVTPQAGEQSIKKAVRAAAEGATDFSWLSRGDAVFIKPALNSGHPYPATTSPVALGVMVKLLEEKGAGRVIVGDMSGIEHVKLSPGGLSGSTRQLMEAAGMAEAVRAAGGELHFFEEAGWQAFYEDLPASGAHWKRGLMMPTILQEVQHIVLMPRCSRHVLAGSTLGLKAAVGYWRTDTRLEYHRDAATFQEKTAEANTVGTLLQKQRLVLSAADKILTTFGPDRGLVFHPENGLAIASESVVAHDMVSLAWLLENRNQMPSSEKEGLKDPYNYQLAVTIANHWVVGKLGGWGPVFAAEKLTRNDIHTIWDDRVLNQAYRDFGGLPRLILETANKRVPESLVNRLNGMVTPS